MVVKSDLDTGRLDPAAVPDGVVPLRVRDVIRETGDAVSVVLEVPDADAHRFRYRAGQFLTLVIDVDGRECRRSYSMSSSPEMGEPLRITVKRDGDGRASNWLNDVVAPGDHLLSFPPQGRFVLGDDARPLIAFAGGSGITPVFSLLRSSLATTRREARLYYANRTRDAVIFDAALDSVADRHPGRFVVQHHLDDASGLVTPALVEAFVGDAADAEFYVCGPNAFMDTVCAALRSIGVPPERLHVEHFDAPVTAEVAPPSVAAIPDEVTIVLDGRTTTARYSRGDTLLQTARMAGLRAPSSCETGSCGTCMARLSDGTARMINNDALEADEVDDGWVLTCQALPTSSTVRVEYQ